MQRDRLVAIGVGRPGLALPAIDEMGPELAGDAIREPTALARQDDGMAGAQGADIGEDRVQAVRDLDGDQGAGLAEAARRFVRSCGELGEADLLTLRGDDRDPRIESFDVLK